ncbi:MAG: hypothetical protein JOZ72_15090 [Alphaproteobacteria bacterium]|nr:hypothetical protein [Alphaproteobacteria bacterium]
MKQAAIAALALAMAATAAKADDVQRLSDSANPGGQILADKPTFQATLNTDEKTASITGTFNLKPFGREPEKDYLSFTIQTPQSQGQNYTNTVTLDGLTKATTLSLKFIHSWGGFVRGSSEATFASPSWQTACWDLFKQATSDLHSPQPFKTCDAGFLKDITADRATRDEAARVQGASSTTVAQNKALEDKLAKELDDLNKNVLPVPADLWIVSLGGSVGYEQHNYYDPVTLAAGSLDKTPWQASASLGYVPKELPVSFNLSAKYQESYLDGGNGTTQTKCINSGATCVNGFIGAPLLHDKALIGADIRWIGNLSAFGIPFGLDPGVTYDAIGGQTAVQVPLYLLTFKDDKGAEHLSGGIRYDWTSTTHVSTVGIFVSTAFSLF